MIDGEHTRFEWAHLPQELGAQALSYSEVDVDAFQVFASRFHSYAEHVCGECCVSV